MLIADMSIIPELSGVPFIDLVLGVLYISLLVMVIGAFLVPIGVIPKYESERVIGFSDPHWGLCANANPTR